MTFSNNKEENFKSEKTCQFLSERTPWFVNYGTYIISAIMIVLFVCLLIYLNEYDVVPFKFMK